MSVQGNKTKSPGWIRGGHWVVCQRCDFTVRHKDTRKEWTGAIVCTDCWEPRHPQDFVRGVPDDMSAKGNVNPPTPDRFIDDSGFIDTLTDVPEGSFNIDDPIGS